MPNKFAEFRAWREKQIAAINTARQTLTNELAALIPEPLRKLFEEDPDILQEIIDNDEGIVERNFQVDQGAFYGYKGLKELKDNFKHLCKAWEGQIIVTAHWADHETLHVHFRVI